MRFRSKCAVYVFAVCVLLFCMCVVSTRVCAFLFRMSMYARYVCFCSVCAVYSLSACAVYVCCGTRGMGRFVRNALCHRCTWYIHMQHMRGLYSCESVPLKSPTIHSSSSTDPTRPGPYQTLPHPLYSMHRTTDHLQIDHLLPHHLQLGEVVQDLPYRTDHLTQETCIIHT